MIVNNESFEKKNHFWFSFLKFAGLETQAVHCVMTLPFMASSNFKQLETFFI
jgi:hypothetical protein